MELLFLCLYPLSFVLAWFLLVSGLKTFMKQNYKTRYAVIALVMISPLIVVLLGFAAVTFLPFPHD
jgi:hypothetical protein